MNTIRELIWPSPSKMNDPSVVPLSGKCMWWKLPREVRDMILVMSYQKNGPVRLVLKCRWDAAELHRRITARNEGRQYTVSGCREQVLPQVNQGMLSFSNSKADSIPKARTFTFGISKFLVSKTWLHESIASYFSSIHYECNACWNLFDILHFKPIPNILGLNYITTLTVDFLTLAREADTIAERCPLLLTLHVDIHSWEAERVFDIEAVPFDCVVWFDAWTIPRLHQASWSLDIQPLSGVKTATLTLREPFIFTRSEAEVQTLYNNVGLLETVFQSIVTRPKETFVKKAARSRVRRTISCDWSEFPSVPLPIPDNYKASAPEVELRSMVRFHPREAVDWMLEAQRKLQQLSLEPDSGYDGDDEGDRS